MARAVLSSLLVLSVGCGDDLTEIFVCYSLDPAYDRDVGGVNVVARTTDDRLLFSSAIDLTSASPSSQGFVQDTADGVQVRLEATIANQPDPLGGAPITLVISQAAVVDFQPGRVVDLSLSIARACGGVDCSIGRTCVDGTCLPDIVDSACLADRGGTPPPGCDDGRVLSACPAAP